MNIDTQLVTLKLLALKPEDQLDISRLVRGLRFKQPLKIHSLGLKTEQELTEKASVWNQSSSDISGVTVLLVAADQCIEQTLFLKKPISARELLNCINGILDTLH